jgi:hypothetical protein
VNPCIAEWRRARTSPCHRTREHLEGRALVEPTVPSPERWRACARASCAREAQQTGALNPHHAALPHPPVSIPGSLRELVGLLDGVGRHDQVAVVRLERWLRARGDDDEADRVA